MASTTRRDNLKQLALLAGALCIDGSAESQTPLAKPFAYKGTDTVNQVPMSASNSGPALVVWLFLTTNTDFPRLLAGDQGIAKAQIGYNQADIASALGLTEGCVKFIVNLAQQNNTSFAGVTSAFQKIRAADKSIPPLQYSKPCPGGGEIMALAKPAAASVATQ